MLLPPPVLAPESVVVRPPVQARPQSVVGRPSLVSVKVPHDLHDGASGFDFTYLGFQFHAALPDNVSPGTPVIVRLSADAWAQAWASAKRSILPRPKPMAKPSRQETDDEAVRAHLSLLISRVERKLCEENARLRREEAARRRAAREQREVGMVIHRCIKWLEQAEREEAKVRREVSACVQRLVGRVERQAVEDACLSAWRAADPEVAFVLRGVIKNVEEACESQSREQREAARIEREVAAVVRRLVSRVEHTSSEFEALVGGEEYERDQLAKLDTFLTSLGASPGLIAYPGWTIRLDVRQSGGTAGDTDLYYFDERRKKFRSKLEVARHFGLQAPPRKPRAGVISLPPMHAPESPLGGWLGMHSTSSLPPTLQSGQPWVRQLSVHPAALNTHPAPPAMYPVYPAVPPTAEFPLPRHAPPLSSKPLPLVPPPYVLPLPPSHMWHPAARPSSNGGTPTPTTDFVVVREADPTAEQTAERIAHPGRPDSAEGEVTQPLFLAIEELDQPPTAAAPMSAAATPWRLSETSLAAPQTPKIKRRRVRCKVCDGCRAPICGACSACLDKPQFGGRGIAKAGCRMRKCTGAIANAAPPHWTAQLALPTPPAGSDPVGHRSSTTNGEGVAAWRASGALAAPVPSAPASSAPAPSAPALAAPTRRSTQRRSAGLASSAWRAIRESDRAARLEASEAERLRLEGTVPSSRAQRLVAAARPSSMEEEAPLQEPLVVGAAAPAAATEVGRW